MGWLLGCHLGGHAVPIWQGPMRLRVDKSAGQEVRNPGSGTSGVKPRSLTGVHPEALRYIGQALCGIPKYGHSESTGLGLAHSKHSAHSCGCPDCRNAFISLVLGRTLGCCSYEHITVREARACEGLQGLCLNPGEQVAKDLDRQLRSFLPPGPEAWDDVKVAWPSPRIISKGRSAEKHLRNLLESHPCVQTSRHLRSVAPCSPPAPASFTSSPVVLIGNIPGDHFEMGHCTQL